MKFKNDKNLLKISIYVVLTAVAIYIAYGILGNIDNILKTALKVILVIITLLKPLIIAFVIAYLLYPLVRFIERFLGKIRILKKVRTRRGIGIIITYLLLSGLITLLIVGIYFMIGGEISENITIINIFENITNYVKNIDFNISYIENIILEYNIPIPSNVNELIATLAEGIKGWITNLFDNGFDQIANISGNIVSTFIAVIISIYLLIDTEYFLDIWKKFYYLLFRKSKIGKTIAKIAVTMHETFYNYIKGQLLDAIIVGILSSVVLAIIGVDYAIVIGIIAGICNMIPYIGPVIGTVLASIIALLSGEFILILWVIIAMLIIQQIDNNILAPKIVGDSVGLHPIFTMLAILIGGNIGGLMGMLLAVPVTAAAKILIKEWYANNIDFPNPQKKESNENKEEENNKDN